MYKTLLHAEFQMSKKLQGTIIGDFYVCVHNYGGGTESYSQVYSHSCQLYMHEYGVFEMLQSDTKCFWMLPNILSFMMSTVSQGLEALPVPMGDSHK